jgi:hypothetical protein
MDQMEGTDARALQQGTERVEKRIQNCDSNY